MATFGDPRLPTRFWAKVQVDEGTGCWVWTAALQNMGYGQFPGMAPSGSRLAHRAAYELLVGLLPLGCVSDHLCGRRSCVNPDHIEPVTQKTNVNRRMHYENYNSRKTHCRKGHSLVDAYIGRSGGRRRRLCRECVRIRNEAASARRRAA